MLWVLAGLLLHLIAIALLVGYLTNWFAFGRSAEPDRVDDRKNDTTKPKWKPNN
jgi:hypothetical protein